MAPTSRDKRWARRFAALPTLQPWNPRVALASRGRPMPTFLNTGVCAVRRRDVLDLACAAAAAAFAPRIAFAQSAWPSANITIVVPFTPGGLTDILARAISDKIAPVLGRPVIVD